MFSLHSCQFPALYSCKKNATFLLPKKKKARMRYTSMYARGRLFAEYVHANRHIFQLGTANVCALTVSYIKMLLSSITAVSAVINLHLHFYSFIVRSKLPLILYKILYVRRLTFFYIYLYCIHYFFMG